MNQKEKQEKEVIQNYDWFKKNRKKIIAEHPDKIDCFVIIKNQKIRGFFQTIEEAIYNGHKKFEGKHYSIQQLEKKERPATLGSL